MSTPSTHRRRTPHGLPDHRRPDDTATLAEWLSWDEVRGARIAEYGLHTSMSVPIKARGQTLGVAVLTRFRRPDPFTPDDILLAEEVTARAGVCIDNARRFSRERETALALQRSLLPSHCPGRPPWRRPPAICPPHGPEWAATGST